MRRFILIAIVTGVTQVVAQAATAQLEVIPMTVSSQTLKVSAFGMGTGDVVGDSSVNTSWNFGNEHGSTVGSVSSDLVNGELVVTVDGALSKGATTNGDVSLNITVELSMGFAVPGSVSPILGQLTKADHVFTGPVTFDSYDFYLFNASSAEPIYSSQLLGGLAKIGYIYASDNTLDTSIALPLNTLIPNDTVEGMEWLFYHGLEVAVDNSTGTFSETFTIRLITTTLLPEPSASLTIPTGAAMLLALAKARGVSLIH